uniref:Secreted protein n=1 Tax=Parastrongyloides trichosuri TaxID=131310 RepID=A0A0N4YZY0_PARTI
GGGRGALFLAAVIVVMGGDDPVGAQRQVEVVENRLPGVGRGLSQALGDPQGAPKHVGAGHETKGVVVRRRGDLGRSHGLQKLKSPTCSAHPAHEPVGHSAEDRPSLFLQKSLVARGVGEEGEGAGHMQGDMILMMSGVAGAGRRLLARAGRGLLGILQPLTVGEARIGRRSRPSPTPEGQHGARRVRLHNDQGREAEGVHIPHHVAVVVVIVPPGREAEDRGGGRRSGVGGSVQVVEGGVDKRLLPRTRADKDDPTLPYLRPG